MESFPVRPLLVMLAALVGCGNDTQDPLAPALPIDASVSSMGTIAEGAVLELGKPRLLKTGAVRVRVRFGCAEGLEVLEAHVSVSQSLASGLAGFNIPCTGRRENFFVTVTALEGSFQPGDATVSAFGLVIDQATGLTQQAQDTRTQDLH